MHMYHRIRASTLTEIYKTHLNLLVTTAYVIEDWIL